MSYPIYIRRWHRDGSGHWTIYEFVDTGDKYMLHGHVMLSSRHAFGEDSAVATNKKMLSEDLNSGMAEFVSICK